MAFDVKKWGKKYHIEHREEILQKAKKYYQKHKECIKKRRNIYRKTLRYKDWLKRYKKTYSKKYGRQSIRNNNPWLIYYYNIRGRCYQKTNGSYPSYGAKGINCCITKKELKRLWFRDEAYNMDYPSIHRKDHNKDYTFSNCQFIEWVKNKGRPKK